jgi:hypothetical protein
MTYALGRHVEYEDMPTVRAIVREAGANNNHFSSFVAGIIKSPAFQMSTVESLHTTASAPPRRGAGRFGAAR